MTVIIAIEIKVKPNSIKNIMGFQNQLAAVIPAITTASTYRIGDETQTFRFKLITPLVNKQWHF